VRRPVAGLSLLLASGSLAGCGLGGSSSPPPAPAAITIPQLTTLQPSDAGVMGARGSGVATAANLAPADLPSFRFDPTSEGRTDRPKIAKCAGGAPLRMTVDDEGSPQLASTDGSIIQEIRSEVAVLRSTRAVRRDMRSLNSFRGLACIGQSLHHQFTGAPEGGSGLQSRVHLDRLAVPGEVRHAFGLRVVFPVTVGNKILDMYVDFFGVQVGHAELGLSVAQVGHPQTKALEADLLSTLVFRGRHYLRHHGWTTRASY
jgi:hypothetical protein